MGSQPFTASRKQDMALFKAPLLLSALVAVTSAAPTEVVAGRVVSHVSNFPSLTRLQAFPAVARLHTSAPVAAVRVVEPVDTVVDIDPHYSFGYSITDAVTGDSKNRQETRDGNTVTGSYSVADPDGRIRTVTYEAGPGIGFVAHVTYDGAEGPVAIPFDAPNPSQTAVVQVEEEPTSEAAVIQARVPEEEAAPAFTGVTPVTRFTPLRALTPLEARVPKEEAAPVVTRVSPVTRFTPLRAVSPLRSVTQVRAVTPVHAVTQVRAVTPVHALNRLRAVTPVRAVSQVRAVTPVRTVVEPIRAVHSVSHPITRLAEPTFVRNIQPAFTHLNTVPVAAVRGVAAVHHNVHPEVVDPLDLSQFRFVSSARIV